MLHHGTFRFLCCVVVLLVGQPECVKAQPSTGRIRSTATGRVPDLAGRVGPRMTFVEVKLLVGTDGGALHSQRWLKVLEALDVSLQIVKAESARSIDRETFLSQADSLQHQTEPD